MANPKNVDLTEDRLFHLRQSLTNRLVCAPADWSAEKVADEATHLWPPGTRLNRWDVVEPTECGGDFNGANHLPCPDSEGRAHWLLEC